MTTELPPARIEVERLRRRLLRQAQLFDEPGIYAAGVDDAIDALLEIEDVDEEPDRLAPAGGWFG